MANFYEQARLCYENGDYIQSAELYKKAADKGNAEAMFSLGVMYLLGQGVVKDVRSAKSYISKAKYYNHPVAMFYLDLIRDLTQEQLDEDETVTHKAI